MPDIILGTLDSRELTLRTIVPLWFQRWDGRAWRFAPLKLLNPLHWVRVARWRSNWRLECWRHSDQNRRCYCQTGCCIDGAVVLCGFGVVWFYSRFDGALPCPCDVAMEEFRDA